MRRMTALLILVAACGGDSPTSQPSELTTTLASAAPTTPAATESATTEIKASDFAFSPRTLTVPAGTTVTVRNTGNAPHTWTRKPDFDIALDERGATGEFTFTQRGTYEYVCTIHEGRGMTGSVVVT